MYIFLEICFLTIVRDVKFFNNLVTRSGAIVEFISINSLKQFIFFLCPGCRVPRELFENNSFARDQIKLLGVYTCVEWICRNNQMLLDKSLTNRICNIFRVIFFFKSVNRINIRLLLFFHH